MFPVFVDNISSEAQTADLRKIFAEYGEVVEVTIVSEHGFVNFSRPDDAIEAIRYSNGKTMLGQSLCVDASKELEDFFRDKGGLPDLRPPPHQRRSDYDRRGRGGGYNDRRGGFRGNKGKRPFNQRDRYDSRRSPDRHRRTPPRYERRPPPDRFKYPERRSRSPDRRHHRSTTPPRLPTPPHRSRSPIRSRSRPRSDSRRDSSTGGNRRKITLQQDVPRPQNVVENKVEKEPMASSDQHSDLRELLRRKKAKQNEDGNDDFLHAKIQVKDDENRAFLDGQPDENVQVLYIGNLFNQVEKDDVERLLDVYGNIKDIQMKDSYALVHIECSKSEAEEVIKLLDRSQWMENQIRVKFNERKKFSFTIPAHDKYGHCDRVFRDRNPSTGSTGSQEEREPRAKYTKISSSRRRNSSSNDAKPIEPVTDASADGDAAYEEENEGQGRQRIKTRTLRIYCETKNKNYMRDMVEIFGNFGRVKTNVWDGPLIKVQLESSEKQALKCIAETNKIRYKGQPLKVKFADGSYEDSQRFRDRNEEFFKNYPRELQPVSSNQPSGSNPDVLDEVPIGVLPPSSSLGAFGAVPETEALSSIMATVKAMTQLPVVDPNAAAKVETKAVYQGAASRTSETDPMYLANVDGTVYSVSNKIVLIQFFTGAEWRLAKFIPGQMFVDGKFCLGYAIKNNAFHAWPANVRSFLNQGARVKMDVKKMSDAELSEVQEVCSESVLYTTPLVWKQAKPNESVMSVNRGNERNLVLKGTVSTLYPKWGVLSTSKGDVFFEIQAFYSDNAFLGKTQSLLKYLEKGDTVATECTYVPEYLEMSEIARSAEGFTGRTDTLKYQAGLVWPLSSEIDPHGVKAASLAPDDAMSCDFLATSSTLFKPLPSERESQYKSWTGTLEEVHLPAGGIIVLDEALGLAPDHRYVYFHRSRLYINGMKMQSSSNMSAEIVPGDRVTVDVVENVDPSSHVISVNAGKNGPYVSSRAYWVAVSVHLNTTQRGVSIARALKLEVFSRCYPLHFGGKIIVLFVKKTFCDTKQHSKSMMEIDNHLFRSFSGS